VLDAAQAHVYKGMTLGQYLQEQGYSEAFRNNYVLPMCAAVWSVPNATVSTWTSSNVAWGKFAAKSAPKPWCKCLQDIADAFNAANPVYLFSSFAQQAQPCAARVSGLTPLCGPCFVAAAAVVCVQVLAFPVQMLVRFWVNHHLLDLVQRPCWRVVKGRSKTYVDKVLAGEQREVNTGSSSVRFMLPEAAMIRLQHDDQGAGRTTLSGKQSTVSQSAENYSSCKQLEAMLMSLVVNADVPAELPDVRTSTPISSLQRNSNGSVTLTTAAGKQESFDAVVLATHSDISLQILGQAATKEERAVLAAIPYNNNDVYLHTDVMMMPVDKKAWASWNFLVRAWA
jgi:predicted NAD/FAD-binding protein